MKGLSLDLKKIFPLTLALLSEEIRQSLLSEFVNDWGVDQLHFFPMLVRSKKMSRQIQEVADYEYLRHWLRISDFPASNPGPFLRLHPSLQTLLIQRSSSVLQKEAGIYFLWKKGDEVFEKKADEREAFLVDQLREDIVFSLTDLAAEEKEVARIMAELGLFAGYS